jgi:hypothetical protein
MPSTDPVAGGQSEACPLGADRDRVSDHIVVDISAERSGRVASADVADEALAAAGGAADRSDQELHIRGVDRVSIDYRRRLGELALGA